MKKLIIILIALTMLFAGCTDKSETTPTEEVKMEKPSPTATKEEQTKEPEQVGGFSELSRYIEKMDQATEFMDEGIDKSGDMNLSMEFITIKMSAAQLTGALYVYENYGENWDSGIVTDKDYDITTQTTVTTENGITTYKNIAYGSKEAQNEAVVTIVAYNPQLNVVQIITKIEEPESNAVYQFYMDENDAIYYVFAETAANTLFTDVMYYDGSFIGIAKAWFDGEDELTLPYDLTESKPSSYEELLVYDSYRTEFTYDGTDAVIEKLIIND